MKTLAQLPREFRPGLALEGIVEAAAIRRHYHANVVERRLRQKIARLYSCGRGESCDSLQPALI